MKKLLLLFSLLVSIHKTASAQAVRFVAPNGIGAANGATVVNAADFLNDSFWIDIQNLLQTQPVIVKFADGNYVRAYTTKTLYIRNMGNAVNRLTLEGSPLTASTAPTGYATKSLMVSSLVDSENITIRDFHFTGNGSINDVFRVSSADTGDFKIYTFPQSTAIYLSLVPSQKAESVLQLYSINGQNSVKQKKYLKRDTIHFQ